MVKMSKEDVLKALRAAQLAEYVVFAEDVIDPMAHLKACDVLRHIERQVEKNPRTEYEADD